MKKKIYSILKILFFIGFGIFCIIWFLNKMTPDEKRELMISFQSANYFWVIIAFFLEIIAHLLRALRWQQLLEPMGYRPRFKMTFSAVMVGYLANLAVPRLGEIVRCGILDRYEKIPMQKSLGTVISERVVDILVFGLIFLAALFIEFEVLKNYLYDKLSGKIHLPSIGNLMIIGLAAIILSAFLTYYFRKRLLKNKFIAKIFEFVKGFLEGIRSIFKLKNPFLFIFYSFAIWIFYFLCLYVLLFCFTETGSLPLKTSLIIFALGSFGMMITPGGIGLYPLLIAESLAIYKIPTSLGYALGWISWVVQQGGVLIIGMFALIILSIFSHKKQHSGANIQNVNKKNQSNDPL